MQFSVIFDIIVYIIPNFKQINTGQTIKHVCFKSISMITKQIFRIKKENNVISLIHVLSYDYTIH